MKRSPKFYFKLQFWPLWIVLVSLIILIARYLLGYGWSFGLMPLN